MADGGADDSAVTEEGDDLAVMGAVESIEEADDSVGELEIGLGIRDGAPLSFADGGDHCRVVVVHHLSVAAAFGDSQVDLSQVPLDPDVQGQPLGERGGGLLGPNQHRGVDGIDRLVGESVGQPFGLPAAARRQRRIAVPVDQLEGLTPSSRDRLAVADENESGGAGRGIELRLREPVDGHRINRTEWTSGRGRPLHRPDWSAVHDSSTSRVRRLWDDEVVDPLAWLEHPDSEAVTEFLVTENQRTGQYFDRLADLRTAIFEEIKGRVKETDLSVPVRKDQWEYYGRTVEGLQYGLHCRRLASVGDGEPGPEVVVLDENRLAEGHEYFDLGIFDISTDHALCLYGMDVDGDEKYELHLLDIGAGTHTSLGIAGVSAGSAWDNSGSSFLYLRPDETNRPAEVWRHVLGTDPAGDERILTEPDRQFFVGLGKERDDSFVHISFSSAVTDETRLIPADDLTRSPVVVSPRQYGVEYSVAHHRRPEAANRFFMHTNREAVNFRVLEAPVDGVMRGDPVPDAWTEVVPHRDSVMLAGFEVFANHMVLVERDRGLLRLRVRRLSDGEEHIIGQPEEVSTVVPGANPEPATVEFRFTYTSMVTPAMVCSYHFDTRARTVLKQTPVLGGFEPAQYQTERIWAVAEDRTRIPILLAWRRDRSPGPHPAVLYGYGAYEASMDPVFSIARLSLLDRGFTFAIAQVRGGGELGRRWYEAGKYQHKKRSFSDFVACANELVDRGLTTPAQLGIRGGSAGGLLVAAALNLKPESFGAVVAEVPFVDVVNTMIDTSQQLTQIEWDEWGNPLESEEIYRAMVGYSPYENVVEAHYPPVLVTAGMNDPRVRFWEPAKWVLRLREHNLTDTPILLKTELGAGHFGPTGRYDAWRDEAEVLAFLVHALE